jgi:futalosine hydrolase
MPRILILCATGFEMAGFLDQHKDLAKQKTRSSLTLYSGTKGSDIQKQTTFDCMISGPGVFNTTHALTVYLEQTIPDLILHTGIAGAFAASGIGIGDIALAGQERYVHIGVGCDPLENSPLPFDLIESQPLTRQGIYPFDQELVDKYHGLFTRKFNCQVARGGFITVSSITDSPGYAGKIFTAFSPVMEAMEGAAVAHVAALYQVPVVEIRAASNFVGERDREKWDFPLACQQVSRICNTILGHAD